MLLWCAWCAATQLAGCASDATGLEKFQTPVHFLHNPHLYICAGPLNFIIEKAKFTGVVSAQLKEAKRQGGSGACLTQLADALQSEDSSTDINVYNGR